MTRAVRSLQATVRRFNPADRTGEALDDSGSIYELPAERLDPAVRHLRPGQRVRLEWIGEELTLVTIATLPASPASPASPAGAASAATRRGPQRRV
jgi:hypothetical protein